MKQEPRQLSGWLPFIGTSLVILGMALTNGWLTVLGTVVDVAWLVQRFRWASWDVKRQAAMMERRRRGDLS